MKTLGSSLLAILCLLVAMCFLNGCKDRTSPLYGTADEVERDREGARKLIQQLGAKRVSVDPEVSADKRAEADANYEEAKQALVLRGSGIQSLLFEELAATDNWGVRYGIVEVLNSVGTKRMVEPLISVLDDEEPRVAFMAMQILRVVCDHRVVPREESDDAALPPIPESDGDAEAHVRLWRQWHAINGRTLREEWSQWWRENQHRVRIE